MFLSLAPDGRSFVSGACDASAKVKICICLLKYKILLIILPESYCCIHWQQDLIVKHMSLLELTKSLT